MENQPAEPPVNSNLKNVVIIVVAFTAIVLVCTLPMIWNRPDKVAEGKAKGISSAKSAVRYLNDLREMTENPSGIDSDAFDKKWRWAWQEIEAAEKADVDKDITENLRCSHAGFAGHLFGHSGNTFSCLRAADQILKERYGK